MSESVSVEATGETVGEAKWAAVRELERLAPGLDREAVSFQVVSEGERGLLGVGTTPAVVVATAPVPAVVAAAPVEAVPADEAEIAAGLVARALAALQVEADVEVVVEDDAVVARVAGGDSGVLIGRHGQMLDALQVLANGMAHHMVGPERRRIVIDAGGYRDRRAAALETLARRTAERVAATGHACTLDPMPASERRLVHEALKDDPEVVTESDGAEPYRCVVVLPRRAAV